MNPSAPHVPSLEETRAGPWVRSAFVVGGTGALSGIALLAVGNVAARLFVPGSPGWRAGDAVATLGWWTGWGGVLSTATGLAVVLAWLVLPCPSTEPSGR